MDARNWEAFYKNLGQKLNRSRELANFSQEDVAKLVSGLTAPTLSRYESGRKAPIHILVQLAEIYGRDLSFFLSDMGKAPGEDIQHKSDMRKYRTITTRLLEVFENCDLEEPLLNGIIAEFAEAINVAIIAVLKYDWVNEEITRVAEYVNPTLTISLAPYADETYKIGRDDFISPNAWTEEHGFRYIPDYRSVRKNQPQRVNSLSYDRHAKALHNELLSTMYGLIDKPDKTYLIRCFERSDVPRLALDPMQFKYLTDLCSLVSQLNVA